MTDIQQEAPLSVRSLEWLLGLVFGVVIATPILCLMMLGFVLLLF